jgi:hypothetical protein
MKQMVVILCAVVGSSFLLSAQEKEKMNSKLGLGFHLIQNQADYGLGVNVTSPFFARDILAFRLKGNLVWNQHLTNTNITTWTPYSNLSLGLVAVGGEMGDFVRLYSEGGALALFPSPNFSSESLVLGGYGLFGFEFFMDPASSYFIEIGGAGTGAIADKVPGKPIYSNGLILSVGYRYTF